MHHPGLAIYEIYDTVALLRNVLFRDHLDCLLCDYPSHEGSSVWNIGSGGTDAWISSDGLNSRKYVDLQLSDDVLEGSFRLLCDRGAPYQRQRFCEQLILSWCEWVGILALFHDVGR